MNQKILNLKLAISLILGIIGIISLIFNFSCLYHGGVDYYTLTAKICKIYKTIAYNKDVPFFLCFIFGILIEGAFLIFFFLSPLGIFLANKAYESTKQNLAIFAIVLNVINLIFSIFIGWAILGLTTGARLTTGAM